MAWAASSRDSPMSARNRRSLAPTSMRRTVGPRPSDWTSVMFTPAAWLAHSLPLRPDCPDLHLASTIASALGKKPEPPEPFDQWASSTRASRSPPQFRVRPPRANAYAERWVGTVRRELG